MRLICNDSFVRCNYVSIIFLLTVSVIVYILIFEREVQADYEYKSFRQGVILPDFLKTPPNKVVNFTFDMECSLHNVDKRFLSFSIDSSQIYKGLRNPSLREKRLVHPISHLKGGYLRVGGTAADMLVFTPVFGAWPDRELPLDGGHCSFNVKKCVKPPKHKKFSMSAADWNEINNFAITTGLKLLFDFNVLLRENGNWNSSNGELLLDFSFAYHYEIDWQLGNEPNAFKHVFGMEIDPKTLANDFNSLKKLLQKYSLYNSSLVIGPDITNPHHLKKPPEEFLLEFLTAEPNVDAISWHHYNTGPEATLEDFLNVKTYDDFLESYKVVEAAIKKSKISPKPVWLTETGSSYGGGAKNLSNRFVGSLLWTDKLGLAAKAGISVVVRQSLYRGEYSLLDSLSLKPNPDYWVSVLYKKMVKETVLNLTVLSTPYDGTLRAYAHCSVKDDVVIFGVNLSNLFQGFYVPLNKTGNLYSLYSDDLQSRSVMLNGYELFLDSEYRLPVLKPVKISLSNAVPIPPYSIFFIQVEIFHPACYSF
ncbi:heparanase [Halyomorpha halys]|uniref:heparanase n=1 Tax=Halyomorpha halys TaxID=286706 RepID=UPI000D0C8FCC|nr:heparanase-like [Halyomorpha halys]